jgi:squalene-hopene/tetraprenyl-beta-curcumene cyclase
MTDAALTPESRAASTRAAGIALGALRDAVRRCREYLLSIQDADGEWCAELEGDTILESEYILTMHFIGRSGEPKIAKAAEYIRRQQLESGGWAIYPGGPPEPSASVKAYFVLKLLGDDPDAPHMQKARRAILEMGGIDAVNSFTKIYLSIFGQYEWSKCPTVPPSIALLPKWFPFNLYEMSSWSRAIVVPLSIISAYRPRCAVPAHADIPELRSTKDVGPTDVTKYTGERTGWTRFFAGMDRFLKVCEKLHLTPFRRWGLRRSERWTLDRLRMSDGLGAIFPPIINTIIALRCRGYPLAGPILAGQVRELEKLEIEEDDTLRVQPCFSALWDTAQTLNVLLEAGVEPDHEDMLRPARWLLDHEVRHVGDWAVKVPDVEPGGWYFEYANEFYPDCDDTAEVLIALAKVRFPDAGEEARRKAAIDRGLTWLLAMQNEDGGWAAFDKGCDREFLTHVPFADHNAMLDPSCEDITGRVLESLHVLGRSSDDPVVRRAIAYMYEKQQGDGSWFGRWGCNYVYGTWLALQGLRAVGEDPRDPRMQRAAAWMRAYQNADGGWGETPLSYDMPEMRGRGPSTAAQTAWALLGLFAVDECDSPTVQRGLEYLQRTQREDGSWCDEPWTGTGFPRVFYLRYHLYATQFPLLALAACCDRFEPARESSDLRK